LSFLQNYIAVREPMEEDNTSMTTEAKNSIALPNFVVEQPSSEDPGYKT
jgi:hypothetical protein